MEGVLERSENEIGCQDFCFTQDVDTITNVYQFVYTFP